MYNRVILMGRLVRDPELKTTQSGIAMCRFSVAVDRQYNKGEEKQADFFDVTVWRNTAEFVSKYFTKGKMIHLEGRLQNNNYTDQNGVKHYSTAIIADNVTFCGDKSGGQEGTPEYRPSQSMMQHTAQPTQTVQPAADEFGDLGSFSAIDDGTVPF